MFDIPEELPRIIVEWYGTNRRDLPWRGTADPYRVLVSETMLQQTRIAHALEYYDRFLRLFPDVQSLARAPEDSVLKAWQGLGYYSRARNLHKAAKDVSDRFGGSFPDSFSELLSLPGVGEYTASAIGAICFGLPLPVVDGNVLRVISRVTAFGGNVLEPGVKKEITAALARLIPREAPGDFDQGIMELGETVCLPSTPLCGACPLCHICRAREAGLERSLPVRVSRTQKRRETVDVLLIESGGKVLLRRRQEGPLKGMWSFPTYPSSDSPAKGAPHLTGRHVFTHILWDMRGFIMDAALFSAEDGDIWAGPEDLVNTYAIPSAYRIFLSFILERFKA